MGVTELPEALCRVIPGVNTPDMFLCVPYRTQPFSILVLFLTATKPFFVGVFVS